MIKFNLQLFGGGGEQTTTQSRTIPDQTATEAGLQNNAVNYANNSSNVANGMLGNIGSLAGNASNVYNNYSNTANGISNNYASLANGVLPTSFSTARQTALNNDLTGTVGTAITGLGNRGILNSSVTNGALNNISQDASNTLAHDYSSDLGTYSNLLGSQASNNNSNLSNYEGALSGLINNAGNLQNNTNNLFSTMYNGRMGTAGTTQTTTGGNDGTMSALGSLGSAAILKGALITTVAESYKIMF